MLEDSFVPALKICFILSFVLCTFFLGTSLEARSSYVGYRLFYYKYTEPNVEMSGLLQGLEGDIHFDAGPVVDIGMSGTLSGGSLTYDGETLSDSPRPVATESNDLLTQGKVTFSLPRVYPSEPVSPSFGLGYRFWRNELKDSGGVSGYRREVEYLYFPIGITVHETFDEHWSARFEAYYRHLLEGKVRSKLSDVGPGYPDVENVQDQGKGFTIQYNLVRDTVYPIDYSFGVFLNFWDIRSSDVVATGRDIDNADGDNDPDTGDTESLFEPANETLVMGFNLSVVF